MSEKQYHLFVIRSSSIDQRVWRSCLFVLTIGKLVAGQLPSRGQSGGSVKKYVLVVMSFGLLFCDSGDKVIDSNLQAVVSGLSGDLVLSNYGDNEFKITGNGTVSFPKSWLKESKFKIRVENEPCAQRCTLSETEGTFSDENPKIVSVSCAAKRWEIPVVSSEAISPTRWEQFRPKIKINRYGNILLSWLEQYSNTAQFSKATFLDNKWVTQDPTNAYFSFPNSNSEIEDITFNQLNEGSIIWTQQISSRLNLYVGDFAKGQWNFPGNTQQTLGVISSTKYVAPTFPVVRSNAVGEKIAVWVQIEGTDRLIYKSIFQNGVWSDPSPLLTTTVSDSSDVIMLDAAINDLGNVVVAWARSNGTFQQIYRAEYVSGLWTNEDRVSNSLSNAYWPRVTMNNTGDVYITWFQSDQTTYTSNKIFVAEKHGPVWRYPNGLIDNISPLQAKYAEVKVNDAGQVYIASSNEVKSGGPYEAAVQTKQNGVWTKQLTFLMNKRSDVSSTLALIDMDQQGNVVVAWSLENGDVFMSEFRNKKWRFASPANPLNFNTALGDTPSVSVDNCRATVAWQQRDDSGIEQIYLAQYR